jgi:hypothetical protein
LENFFLKIGVFSDKSTFSQKFQKFFFLFWGDIFLWWDFTKTKKSENQKNPEKNFDCGIVPPPQKSKRGYIKGGYGRGGIIGGWCRG